MKRNLLLLGVVVLVLLIIVNSTKRLSSLRSTSQKVNEQAQRLEILRQENENLKNELEYKKSDEFKEAEIRNKLGLAKPGEAVVVLPQEQNDSEATDVKEQNLPNYVKWWNLFFRS